MNLNFLEHILRSSFEEKTAHHSVNWHRKNRYIGQCAITSLLLHKLYGGEIKKADVTNYGVSHYWNIINDKKVDLTKKQFSDGTPVFANERKINLKKIRDNKDTMKRYKILKENYFSLKKNFENLEKQIYACRVCQNVQNFEHQSVYFGNNCSLLFIGEAPSKNGWQITGKARYDSDNKLIPSGRVLKNLLKIINLNLSDITFTEGIKCLPSNRKKLEKLMNNCQPYLFKQISLLKPRILITLGAKPTKGFIEFKKFADVVGKEFNIKINNIDYILFPIYHPSPISPMSYKGNVKVFKKLKKLLKG